MTRYGKMDLMISTLIPELLKGGKVGILGCKNPDEIINRLKGKGIEVNSEPMNTSFKMNAIYDGDAIVGFENKPSQHKGFFFYLSEHSKITFENGSTLYLSNDNSENSGRGATPLSNWDYLNK